MADDIWRKRLGEIVKAQKAIHARNRAAGTKEIDWGALTVKALNEAVLANDPEPAYYRQGRK
jgi:hypothetical protein